MDGPVKNRPMTKQTTNLWRETVRDIFDTLHFGEDNLFTGSRLAKRIIALIEERHPDYFCEGKTMAEWEAVKEQPCPNK